MLIDSEDPVRDMEATWEHLSQREDWQRPADAEDEQVLLMVTCMETWIVCDRAALRNHYGRSLRESALPPAEQLEQRRRQVIQHGLRQATRRCLNAYTKGKRSFEILSTLSPAVLEQKLVSFARFRRILRHRLPAHPAAGEMSRVSG
jgi:hypothetical protein